MGDEADADWQEGLIEWGREFAREQSGQCEHWPRCECGYQNGRKRRPDPCGRKDKSRKVV
jgi:hypothetical protein